MPDPSLELAAAPRAADLAIQHALSHQPTQIRAKGDRDVATDVDLAVEHLIRDLLRGRDPALGFVGEEPGASGDDNTHWVLDPIDGSINVAHGGPLCAIDLARVLIAAN